jgi:hypothetical protein
MDNPSKRSRHNRTSKSGRKARTSTAGEPASQYSRHSDNLSSRTASQTDRNRLTDLIDHITSESENPREPSGTRKPSRSNTNLVEPKSPPINDNHSSLYCLQQENEAPKGTGLPFRVGQKKHFSPGRRKARHDEADGKHRRQSLGEQRHDQLTKCMESYGSYLESAQQFYTLGMNDTTSSEEQRKLYFTTLW